MAKKTQTRRPAAVAGLVDVDDMIITAGLVDVGPVVISAMANRARATHRALVLLPPDAPEAAAQTLHARAGLRMQSAGASGAAAPDRGFAKLMPLLGVAVVDADPDQLRALSQARAESPALLAAPEREYTLYTAGMDAAWLRGYRDAVDHLSAHLLDVGPRTNAGAAALAGTPGTTWGVLATGADASPLTGTGVRIAVLDTGVDLSHADFDGIIAGQESFIDGETVDDGNGHGTHCAGIAVAGATPHGTTTRYGVAGGAQLYIGRVMNSAGEGLTQSILQGIEWAVANSCRIVSMSLAAQAPRSPIFEQVGLRAKAKGTLLIAAAGNDSSRPDRKLPVGYPANCDSILAVAALDRQFGVARFSNVGGDGGGRIDIAGPGVGVMSAWTGARRYKQESGTSMATPFVAGIAALLAQAHPDATPDQLAALLTKGARMLPGARVEDIGAGLVRAPT